MGGSVENVDLVLENLIKDLKESDLELNEDQKTIIRKALITVCLNELKLITNKLNQ